ncbi:hypothetical protein [Paenibacillus sp. Marseille-Q4541]|uniref:hypothetical protein n=1 Tax=Paenibacillus sp. Marseille-Q4541 TaxID=2831522 RepID=UPI001BA6718D|nr:hypothetical protein [Paenibacillus sp. Marseille-Q4541]
MKNMKISLIAVICIIASIVVYMRLNGGEYNIFVKPTKESIDSTLSVHLKKEIDTKKIVSLDKEVFFVAMMNDQPGLGHLTKKWGEKYSFEFLKSSAESFQDMILQTKEGAYYVAGGQNKENAGMIKVLIEDQFYDLPIPEGEHYIAYAPIQSTDVESRSGYVMYDREGNELKQLLSQEEKEKLKQEQESILR